MSVTSSPRTVASGRQRRSTVARTEDAVVQMPRGSPPARASCAGLVRARTCRYRASAPAVVSPPRHALALHATTESAAVTPRQRARRSCIRRPGSRATPAAEPTTIASPAPGDRGDQRLVSRQPLWPHPRRSSAVDASVAGSASGAVSSASSTSARAQRTAVRHGARVDVLEHHRLLGATQDVVAGRARWRRRGLITTSAPRLARNPHRTEAPPRSTTIPRGPCRSPDASACSRDVVRFRFVW
jgi:hypothetical protein